MSSAISFSTCDFCDAHKANDAGDFRVLLPVFKDFGGRNSFFGPVLTVKCYQDNSHVKKAVESEGKGRVLVVDGAACLQRALLGGNFAAAAARHGWAGVVINGCVRDLSEINVLPIGIRALALNPMPTLRSDQGQTGGVIWFKAPVLSRVTGFMRMPTGWCSVVSRCIFHKLSVFFII